MTDSLVPQKEHNGKFYGYMPFAIVVCTPISIIGLSFIWVFMNYFENGFWSGADQLASFSAESLWSGWKAFFAVGFFCAFFYSIVIVWPVWALLKKLGLRLIASGVLAGTVCALLLMLPLAFDPYFLNNEFVVIVRYIVLQSLVGASTAGRLQA